MMQYHPKISYFALFILALSLNATYANAQNNPPNFVVFLTDDQGWGDASAQGHPHIQTPNFDRFAKQGIRLTNCYAACSVCSPSRSAILTGRTPYRNGVWRWIPSGSQYHLRTSEITIPELLKQKGYATCHVGKWHLNGKFNSPEQPQPNDHGYDWWLATQNNASPSHKNPNNFVRNGKPVGPQTGYSAVLVAEEADRWLKQHRDKSKPFFLSVWTHEPHLPIESDPKYMNLYPNLAKDIQQHHGNISQLDAAFGIVLKTLKDIGADENTFVIFTSDNGPEGKGNSGRTRGSTGGLRGRKRSTFEGGIRVPGAIRWPAYFKKIGLKPGSVSHEPVIGSDIFATVLDIVDIPLPNDRTIDGASMLPLLSGKKINRTQPLYWRNHLSPKSHNVAIRVDDWKIIANDDLTQFELYNLKDDINETTELSAKHPDIFNKLKAKLIATDKQVLEEGPDWWKNEPQKKQRKKTNTKKLSQGVDKTNSFNVVKGGTISKHQAGYQLQAAGEAIALKKLNKPLKGKITLTTSYQSLVTTNTKNAAIVLGDSPDNNALIKIGTAIGMDTHVAFDGDWNNVGRLAKVKAQFKPDDSFNIKIDIDLNQHMLHATINGKQLTAKLPNTLKQISYLGYYAKNTNSAFSEIVISPQ